MQCAKHPEHAADGVCSYSGKPYCTHELVEVEGRFYAKDNVGKVLAEAKKSSAPANVYMNADAAAAASSVPIAQRPPVNHALHIVLSLLSCGLWLPIYLIILLSRSC